MGKRLVVESFQDDLHLLFEQIPVGVAVGVGAGSAVGVDLPGVIAPAHTEKTRPFVRRSTVAKSSAKRRGCHMGVMLNPQPNFRFSVRRDRCR